MLFLEGSEQMLLPTLITVGCRQCGCKVRAQRCCCAVCGLRHRLPKQTLGRMRAGSFLSLGVCVLSLCQMWAGG